ncbi:MAG TPA: hypothetical protein VFR23_12645 [Jiangellaceae bacterium]|nr:hypothetical protein [Jiangellaceae bacterium]
MVRPFRYEWDGTVRRLDLPSNAKLVAAYVSQYADMAGINARPGLGRLAMETRLNEKTVRRYLKLLRDVGLLVRVRSGSGQGRRGKADEYRLAIPEDILERVALVTERRNTGHQKSTVPRVENAVDDARKAEEHRTSSAQCSAGTPGIESRNSGHLVPTQVPETTPAKNTTPDNHSLSEREVTSREADHPKTAIDKGLGWCLPCRAAGNYTLAADTESGTACDFHLREESLHGQV